MKCLHCGNEINDSAKFCRFCGNAVTTKPQESQPVANGEKTCPNCSKSVPEHVKFCRFCGTAFASAASAPEADPVNVPKTAEDLSVQVERNFVTWNILPGQLAVKIDERDIMGYGNIRGLYIAPGTKALFFVNGKHAATLESGKYQFRDFIHDDEAKEAYKPQRRHNMVENFVRNIAGYISNGVQTLLDRRTNIRDEEGERVFYTVVLIRGVNFPLLFTFDKITTANIRSEVGLHIRCKITDVDLFFENNLVDQKFVGYESFSESMAPIVQGVLNQTLSAYSPQQIPNNLVVYDRVLEGLRQRISVNYAYFIIDEIVTLSATQEDLENVRRLKEELYIAEQELEQAQLREDFLNKMQNAQYSNELRSARSQVDFEALMDKIDEDHLLNEDKKAQFVLMLQSERALREARTMVEQQNAVDGLVRSRMLSNEEVDILERNIEHRADMAELSNVQAIAMATLQNAIEIDRETLKWEMEIGNKRFENEMNLQKKRDEYSDTRRNVDLDFQNRQMESKLERLRQAQEIREQREQAQHNREMESRRLDHEAALEHQKITATMSFEQIMASNPDISPAAAEALAKKFEAQAAMAQQDRTAELYRQHDEDLKAILAQQMNLTRDVINAQNQTNARMLSDKQNELNRVHEDAEHHQDRMLSGMNTTVNAVATPRFASAPIPMTPVMQPVAIGGVPCFCSNCGKKNPPNTVTCQSCGGKID